ncbi:hypothetical protein QA584_04090 [Anaerocolumna sp. AGMB13025]|uniref:hypothetical protein n=1 Tax=Anaerocolumna sp. AGMB13025 TaxID=3039116 RepID=UPI00241E40FF|nr:hypothetical protein [Anaerocolumna sp. AGMB13025]WFR58256.1 hypothetical protein QA584_04090 [Anaerocolumna sp. AGMB13025]
MNTSNEVVRLIRQVEFRDKELKKIVMEFCDNKYNNVSSTQSLEISRSFKCFSNHISQDFEWNKLKFFLRNVRALHHVFSLLLHFTTIDYLPNKIRDEYILAHEQLTYLSQTTIQRCTCEQMEYPHSIWLTKSSRNIIINAKSLDIFKLLVDFIDTGTDLYKHEAYKIFLLNFEESMQNHSIISLDDFNYDTFKTQYQYFKDKNAVNALFYFYYYIWEISKDKNLFPINSGIIYEAMKRHTFSSEYLDGYRAYYHNPLENVPLTDKWILIQNEEYKTNNEKTAKLHGNSIDFNRIVAKEYQAIVKEWIWVNTGSSLLTKIKNYGYVVDFLNFICSRKKHQYYEVSIDEVLIYKNNILSTVQVDSNIGRTFNGVKVFLDYCNDTKKINIEKNTLIQLTHSYARINNAEKVSDEDLVKIANKMKEKTYEDIKFNLYYVIFYLLLESEMRLSHILSLEINSIRDTIKKNQYVIEFQTKSSGTFEIKTGITKYIKKHLDSVISSTTMIRNKCQDESINNRIFLKRNINRSLVISPMRKDDFNIYLKNICIELRIKPYTAKNLRDTHMTKSVEYSISKGLHQLTQSILTGHKNTEITKRHYLDEDITEMLELLYQTQIGDINVNGEVLINSSKLCNESVVEKGCGFCKRSHCTDDSYFSCFICKEFATTVDRKSFFEERIKEIDFKLETLSTRHDIEDLQLKKQLLLAYLKKIYIIDAQHINKENLNV